MLPNYIQLGSVPYDEDCVQVSKDKPYLEFMERECQRYKELLEIRFPIPEDVGAYFFVKSFNHDFGTYYEVIIRYGESEKDYRFAYFVEDNCPAKWDDYGEIKYFSPSGSPEEVAEKYSELGQEMFDYIWESIGNDAEFYGALMTMGFSDGDMKMFGFNPDERNIER